jgi:hypothetical protein
MLVRGRRHAILCTKGPSFFQTNSGRWRHPRHVADTLPVRHLVAGATAPFVRIALLAVLGLCLSLGDPWSRSGACRLMARQWSPEHPVAARRTTGRRLTARLQGDRTVRTPNFDRLAREGMYFDNAFLSGAVVLTDAREHAGWALCAHQLGEAVNLWSSFPPEHPLLTDLLRRAGYLTAYSGKGWAPGNYVVGGWAENPVGHRYADFASVSG